jgi:hypothetical protein
VPTDSPSYPNLVAASGVDLSNVNAHLLSAVDRVLGLLGVKGTVISGYRSPEHSVAVGGFANDPHTTGSALDIYVGGRPLGQVPGAVAALSAAGLVSGNQPNFFHGQPDPAHVQLGGGGGTTPSVPPGAGSSSPTGSASTAAGAGCLPAALTSFCVGLAFIVGLCYHFT